MSTGTGTGFPLSPVDNPVVAMPRGIAVSTVIAGARILLNDPITRNGSSVTPRWTDTALLRCVNLAQNRLFAQEPFQFLYGTACIVQPASTVGHTIPVAQPCKERLERWTAGFAMLEDSEDKENLARANALLQ